LFLVAPACRAPAGASGARGRRASMR